MCVCSSLCALLLLAPGAAFADSELIQFDFTADSYISLLGGTIVTPPDGTMDVGSARVSVEATAPGTYVPGGEVVLDQIDVAGTVAKNVQGQADVNGTYAATQIGALAGVLAPGQNGASFATDLILDLDITIGCTGAGCGILGLPVSEIGASALTVSFLDFIDLGVAGSARIETIVPISIGGVLGELTLVGVEVNRTFVPEPGTALLLGLGLTLLARRRTRATR